MDVINIARVSLGKTPKEEPNTKNPMLLRSVSTPSDVLKLPMSIGEFWTTEAVGG